ncbi:MAG: peptidoglycan bridge formation glycyltransferase FemA/FemB family protein [Anaerolineaceae bacterium]|nr:peptidoglycan bridge formation glycyltransferase FemA/FemB family protein [Anaerolineaceae bacterium]NTV36958.1 peptidoglycan bridge formation glycyltransferase FemA/FemB family protein [Anaerolineaceae bacterium]
MNELLNTEWDDFLKDYPEANLLQISQWGDLKALFGWKPSRISMGMNGAQILFRQLPLGFTIAYIPKGPVGKDWSVLWPKVDALCREKRAIFLKVEPDAWEEELPEFQRKFPDFVPSRPIQPQRTITISLDGSEDAILQRMKQKTRYNIRLAEKKDVRVRACSDVSIFHRLMLETGERDRFGVHSLAYYQRAYDLFHPIGKCELLIAEFEDQPLAGLMVFASGSQSYYIYGASSNRERNRMPAYLIQWEAMRWARMKGCRTYDLWGVPDEDEETLENQFEQRSDGLWGVYRFKRGYGGDLKRSVGAWDKVYMPLLYQLYTFYVKRRGGEHA